MKKNLAILLVAWLSGQTCYGQTSLPPTSSTNDKKWAIGINLGTTPGLDVAYQLNRKLSVKLGYSYFAYNLNTTTAISNEDMIIKGDVNMGATKMSLEYFPFKKSTFKLLGGISYVQQGKLTFLGGPKNSYTFQQTVFTAEELGTITFSADYSKGIAPFIGLGFGAAVPKKRVGFGMEVGSYYLKQPEVTFVGTKHLTPMSSQEAMIGNNMKDWRYWPTVNVRLAVRLN